MGKFLLNSNFVCDNMLLDWSVMAKLELVENEKSFGEQQVFHGKKSMFLPQANPGKLYVTDQRIVFKATQGRNSSEFEES